MTAILTVPRLKSVTSMANVRASLILVVKNVPIVHQDTLTFRNVFHAIVIGAVRLEDLVKIQENVFAMIVLKV